MEKEQTFTQEQVNGFVAQATGKLKARITELEQQATDYERVKGELVSAAQTLTTERDTARTELETVKTQHATAIATAEARATESATKYLGMRIAHHVGLSLQASRVVPPSAPYAIELFLRKAKLELDDAGEPGTCTYDGKEMKLREATISSCRSTTGC